MTAATVLTPATLEDASAIRRLPAVLLMCVGLLSIVALIIPIDAWPLRPVPEVVVAHGTGLLMTDGLTAAMLASQFVLSPAAPRLLLIAAYVATATLVLPHMLAFPYTLGQPSFIGGPMTSVWVWQIWHLAYALLVLLFSIADRTGVERRIERPRQAVAMTIALTVLVSLAASLVTIRWPDWLPVILSSDGQVTGAWYGCAGLTLACTGAGVILLLHRVGRPTMLHMGLILALTASGGEMIINAGCLARYTLGWYAGRGFGLLASSVLLVLFVVQVNRLHIRLARAHADLGAVNASLEARVTLRTSELERSLAERNLLLREVYHRVKNNLQVVDSLLGLQAARLSDLEARAALADMRLRVHALGLVHQQLMSSEDLATFDVRPFLRELTSNLAGGTGSGGGVQILTDVDSLGVNLDFAIPLGLLVTELVSNALKHAFPTGAGMISVELRHAGTTVALVVADDGKGLDEDALHGGLGLRIIRGLVRQLEGEMQVSQCEGTRVEVQLPMPVAA